MTLQEVKEKILAQTPRLTKKGKVSLVEKLDYFGNKIEIGDIICRFFSSHPDIGMVVSVADKGIEMTCERITKSSTHNKNQVSTYVTNSMSFRERDFSTALEQLSLHNSTKRIWVYSNSSSYRTQCNNQIVNITKLNLI